MSKFCAPICVGLILSFLAMLTSPADAANTATNTPIKKISEGVFEIGHVRLDKKLRRLSFLATVNMREGTIEYLLVSSTGKLHESIFKTEVEPQQIHIAALLLDAKIGEVKLNLDTRKSEISGEEFSIAIEWMTPGKTNQIAAENLIFNGENNAVMPRDAWLYNGSRIIDQKFLAQRDGSIVSIMTDVDALINSSSPARDNDKIWRVNSTNYPPTNAAVQIVFTFKSKATKTNSP